MKVFIHNIFGVLIICLFGINCSQKTGSPKEGMSVSLMDVGGEVFPFHSPITAIVEYGDSLIVASDKGTLAWFNTENGIITETFTSNSGAVYDVVINGNDWYYSVKDGGIKHLTTDGNEINKTRDSFQIEKKFSSYSPYKLFLDKKNGLIYASTSNGVYCWHLNNADTIATTIFADKTETTANPLRFYGILEDKTYGLLFWGEKGVYSLIEDTFVQKAEGHVYALHDGYRLLENGKLVTGYTDYKKNTVCDTINLVNNPRNFIVKGDYIYAISTSTVEVVKKTTGRRYYIIDLPEKHITRPRNTSCRQIAIEDGSYLYVTPGGNSLYKIPLAPYHFSKEIISICAGQNSLFALSAEYNLYSVPFVSGKDGILKLGDAKYLRSFEQGKQMCLLGCWNDKLVISKDDNIVSFQGFRKTDAEELALIGRENNKEGVTYNYWNNETLYQGRKDMVREYVYTSGAHSPTIVSFPKQPDDGLDCKEDDYYPIAISMTNDGCLVVGTLHSGVVYTSIANENHLFSRIVSSTECLGIRDIKTIDNTVFILDGDSITRAYFDKESFLNQDKTPLSTCKDLEPWIPFLNRIQPIDSKSCFLFSDNYDFCPGTYYCQLLDNKVLIREHSNLNDTFNDVLSLTYNGKQYTVFGGKNGISISYIEEKNGKPNVTSDSFALYAPSDFDKKLVKNWPLGLILNILGILLVIIIIWRLKVLYDKGHDERMKEKKNQLNAKILEGWKQKAIHLKSKKELIILLKEIEATEKKDSSFENDLLDFKESVICSMVDAAFSEASESSTLKQLDDVLILAKKELLTIKNPKYISQMNRQVNLITNRIAQCKKDIARPTRDIINRDYKSGYVLKLFDTLIDMSDISELETNISKFINESKEDAQIGDRNTNRLKLLDEIGLIINDIVEIRCSDCDLETQDSTRIKDSLSKIQSIFERYNYHDDIWDRIFSNCEHYLSFSDCEFFKKKRDIDERTLSESKLKKVQAIKELENKYSLYSVFSELYSGKKNELGGGPFYSIIRDEFDRRCSAFFDSYSKENADNAQWKSVFEKIKDPEDRYTSPYGVSVHKRCFILFPLCAKDSVGKWFWGKTWIREKNDWRYPPKDNDKKKSIHHLSNLTSTNKYGGLFGLMAWAGSININQPGNDEDSNG